jgi:hypothetical protein
MNPGATALQVMLRPANSLATVFVRPITPQQELVVGISWELQKAFMESGGAWVVANTHVETCPLHGHGP